MNSKKFSPAYLTSLILILGAALLIGLSQTWLVILGWILILGALGLNVLAHTVMISKIQGEPTPALVTSLSDMENNLKEAMRDKNTERHESLEDEQGAYGGEEETSTSEPANPQDAPSSQPGSGKLGVLPSKPPAGARGTPRSNIR